MIRKLFTGDYNIELPKVRLGGTLVAIAREVFA